MKTSEVRSRATAHMRAAKMARGTQAQQDTLKRKREVAPKKRLHRELMMLRSGRRTFRNFLTATGKTWDSLAVYLMRRWRAPEAVEQADVVQELLIGVHRYAREWKPGIVGKDGNEVTIVRFVTFNACTLAKRWLHKQRGAGRSNGMKCADWAPGRFARAESSLGRKDATRVASYQGEEFEPDVVAMLDVQRMRSRLRVEVLPHQAEALEVLLVELDIERAANRVYADPQAKRDAMLGSKEDARSYMRRLLHGLADMAGVA